MPATAAVRVTCSAVVTFVGAVYTVVEPSPLETVPQLSPLQAGPVRDHVTLAAPDIDAVTEKDCPPSMIAEDAERLLIPSPG